MQIVAPKVKPLLVVASVAIIFSISYALISKEVSRSNFLSLNSFVTITLISTMEFCIAFFGGRLLHIGFLACKNLRTSLIKWPIIAISVGLMFLVEEIVSGLFRIRFEHDAGIPLAVGFLLGAILNSHSTSGLQN